MIEVYDALCLKEPWLELILLGIKRLETRTKLMRKASGPVVLVSSKDFDAFAWTHPDRGGRLDAAAKQRALAGCGKVRALVDMSGFRLGVPGLDDASACIEIRRPDGSIRFVAACDQPRRLVEVPTVRLNPKGIVVPGASQGFFKIPSDQVRLAA